MPPHLSYHDVDKTYMSGMLEALPKRIGGDVDANLKDKLRYPVQPKKRKDDELLPGLAVKFKLKNVLQLQRVQRKLTKLSRIGIETTADYNSAIRAVLLQLKIPKHVKSDVIRHMIACHMIEEYDFYYPKMETYLRHNELSFSAYVMYVYSGNIWADEFILGALGKMFGIKISVISPAYDDVWDIFHGSAFPHVVIISNGGDFGRKHGPTHFSATKGVEDKWKCVGADDNVGEMGRRSGFEAGRDRTVDHFYEKEKSNLLKEVRRTFANVEGLCQDLSDLCVRREKIYDEVQNIGIKVESFKRLGKFYYDPPEETGPKETAHKTSKQKKSKQHKSDKSKTAPRSCGKFSEEVSANILQETVSEMDQGVDLTELPDQSAVDDILRSRPGGCRIKNARRPKFPSLPKDADTLNWQDEASHTVTTIKDLKQWGTSTEVQNPFNLDASDMATTTEPGVIEARAISPEAQVITEQPRATEDDPFSKKRSAEERSESESKKQRVDDDEDRIIYGGLPMSRQMVRILEQQREESELQAKQEEQRRKEAIQAQVHISCKAQDTVPVPSEHDYIQIAVDTMPAVPFLDQSKISVQGTANIQEIIWEDAQLDAQDNIIGFENQPQLKTFIPRVQITEAQQRAGLLKGSEIIDVTGSAEVSIPTAAQEIIIDAGEDDNGEEKVKHDTTPKVHRSTRQSSLRVFFPSSGSSEGQRDVKVKTKQQKDDVAGAQSHIAEPVIKPKRKGNTEKSTSGKTRGTQNQSGPDVSGAQDDKSVSGGNEIEKIIVSVPQNLDTSKLAPPVPEGERLGNMSYCERCSFSTANKKYMRKHNTRICQALTVVERLKCPEEGCGNLFIHENNYRDHINQHRGVYNYKCGKCGKAFMLQNQLARHKKNC